MSTSNQHTPVLTLRRPGGGRILWRCFSYLRPYWRTTLAAYSTLLVINGLNIAVPLIIRAMVDRGMGQQDLSFLMWGSLALLALTIVKGLLTFVQGYLTEAASQSVAYDLRNAIHSKLQSLSFSYHDRAETGQLLTRAISDVDRIRFLTGRASLRLLDAVVLFLGTAIVLLQLNAPLALLALGTMPFLAQRALHFGLRFRPLSWAIQQQIGVLTARLEQNLRGARVVKAFAQEAAETRRFAVENQRLLDQNLAASRLQATYAPLLDLIANVGAVFIIGYGGLQVIQGHLTLGELVAFSTYLGQLAQPIRRVGMPVAAVAQAMASGERIFEILDAQSEVQEAPDASPLPPIEGRVRFENVSFAYFGLHRTLNDVSFEVAPGQVIALLGATGSGKSTIINLLLRFYDPTAGRITIDGHDLRRLTVASLRAQIGLVMQETTLFAASIRENIAFSRPEATLAEIEAAAQAAAAHDFIMATPQGYDTLVGERGVTLSGGQKQRVAIARALLKDPRILVLDEATSSVDTETERLIQEALRQLMRGRTSFVIAQRLSTVRLADQILVLERGRIAARGTHSELLRVSGLYAEIYHRQLLPQEERGVTRDEV
ncbi:MAG: ABC transporter ATP-binding protein [Chloroflexi bacterium]|nr:ABC transporter ATP-binding protein [Chloroflexota bacterium]